MALSSNASLSFKNTNLAPDVFAAKSKSIIFNLFPNSWWDKGLKLKCHTEEERVEVLAEINRRFGMPLYIPLLALLSSFLLVTREESKVKSWYKYFYFGLAFTILITAEILVRYSGKSLTHGLFYYLLPLFCIPVVYIELIRRFYYENLRK